MRRFVKAIWRFAFRFYGRFFPLWFARLAAIPVSFLLGLLGIRSSVARTNLALAFPHLSDSDRRTIARRSLRNLVTVYLEIPRMRYLSDDELHRHFEVEGLELLRDSSIDRHGALLLSGHIGNWELLAMGAARLARRPFSIIVKGQDDFNELEVTRTAFGNEVIPLHRAALRASRILRDGGVVAMLADQSASRREMPVALFGVETTAFSTPARLALRYRPKVIAGFAVRLPGGKYRASLMEIPHADLEDSPEGIATFTRRYLDALENVVRQYPEQWVWRHKRWKHASGVKYE